MISSGSTAIAGGLAPSAWQREIAQNTAWLNALRSTTSWTRAFTAPQPMLNHEPLLGQSLALLTTAIAQPVQNSPEALRPSRVKPTRIQGSTNPESFLASNNRTQSRGSKTHHVAPSSVTVPIPSHLNNEIPSSSRKRRWTHQATTTAQTKPDRLAQIDQRVDDVRLKQWASIPPRPQDTHKGYPGEYPGVGEGARTQPYQHTLIEQTRHLLKQSYQQLVTDTDYQPSFGHIEQEELLLAHQWATTIGEQIAPLELLQRYAALSRQDNEAVNRNRQNGRTHASALSPLSPDERIPPTINTVGSTSNHAESMQVPLREQAHTMNGHRASNSVEQEAILPPQVAAQLPPLITSQRVDMPPLPVAAATARFGVRAEMMIDEDLDVLAAKIKRILDDEARRHGIDV